jgi:hypothetical protein
MIFYGSGFPQFLVLRGWSEMAEITAFAARRRVL